MKAAIPDLSSAAVTEIARPVGCPMCAHTGYSGSVAVFELLIMDDAARSLALESGAVFDGARVARVQGPCSLRSAGMRKVFEKVTSLEEVL